MMQPTHFEHRICAALLVVTFSFHNGLASEETSDGHSTANESRFAFAQHPSVEKIGNQWRISFSCEGRCDATVAIQDLAGHTIRHLASGVLGGNAPPPFNPATLQQQLFWDGQDDAGHMAPAGCKVRISLGLFAKFDRSLIWHSHDISPGSGPKGILPHIAQGADGLTYVASPLWLGWQVRAYDENGHYVRTCWPPPAADLPPLAKQLYGHGSASSYKLGGAVPRLTIWGDSVYSSGLHGPFESSPYPSKTARDDIAIVLRHVSGNDGARSENLPPAISSKCPPLVPNRGGEFERLLGTHHWCHMTVDRRTDALYVSGRDRNLQDKPVSLYRLDGRTGKIDNQWFPNGEFRCANAQVGPDGLLYARLGPRGQWIIKMDHDGKAIDFEANAQTLPKVKYPDTNRPIEYGDGWCPALIGQNPKVLWTGRRNNGYVQERGLYISPRGIIAAPVEYDGDREAAVNFQGVPADAGKKSSFVRLWEPSGKLITANAIGDMQWGHGISMDREGNIYAALAGALPHALVKGNDATLFGMARGYPAAEFHDVGTLLKFIPNADLYPRSTTDSLNPSTTPVDGGIALSNGRQVTRAQWAWGGLDNQAQNSCSCHHVQYDMDYYARHWIPANYLNSILVIDSNGNLIARLGKYGNVDDSENDIKTGRDGLRFAWMKSIAVSDTAIYVADRPNRRVLRAALSYHNEVILPLP